MMRSNWQKEPQGVAACNKEIDAHNDSASEQSSKVVKPQGTEVPQKKSFF
jgi:hypothetical protein